MKLRIWRLMRRLQRFAPLTLAYGNGSWITIDERDWLQLAIFSRGSYEPEVWQSLARFASADEVVWDVGAYIGSFVLQVVQDERVKSVCAFEPDPLTLRSLRRNLALNGNPAKLYPLALSDTREQKTLIHGPAANTGLSTFSPSASTGMHEHVAEDRGHGGAGLARFNVHCRTADELIAAGDAPSPTLMKVDVEGWEYQVLRGAQQLLQSGGLKAFVFEAACDEKGRLVDNRLRSLVTKNGYAVSRIQRPEGGLRGVENYLAVHV